MPTCNDGEALQASLQYQSLSGYRGAWFDVIRIWIIRSQLFCNEDVLGGHLSCCGLAQHYSHEGFSHWWIEKGNLQRSSPSVSSIALTQAAWLVRPDFNLLKHKDNCANIHLITCFASADKSEQENKSNHQLWPHTFSVSFKHTKKRTLVSIDSMYT